MSTFLINVLTVLAVCILYFGIGILICTLLPSSEIESGSWVTMAMAWPIMGLLFLLYLLSIVGGKIQKGLLVVAKRREERRLAQKEIAKNEEWLDSTGTQ